MWSPKALCGKHIYPKQPQGLLSLLFTASRGIKAPWGYLWQIIAALVGSTLALKITPVWNNQLSNPNYMHFWKEKNVSKVLIFYMYLNQH